MKLPGGYVGKVLKVNLSLGKWITEPLEFSLAKMYVGGYGTGGRILYDNVAGG